MAIAFSQTPPTNPYSTPEPGYYRFTVTNAEMRQGKDQTKPPYLNLTLGLVDKNGRKAGNVFDRIFDSDKPAVLYKLGRMNLALKLNLSTTVELRDLAKILVNRRGVVEIVNEPDSRYPDDPKRIQASVAMFGSEIFWPEEEFEALVGLADAESSEAAPTNEDDPPFTFDDADAPPLARAANDY